MVSTESFQPLWAVLGFCALWKNFKGWVLLKALFQKPQQQFLLEKLFFVIL